MTNTIAAKFKQQLMQRFQQSRQLSEDLCQPLETEDYGLQAVAETSPAKWHIAHTSWFYETFLLKPFLNNFKPFHDQYEHLFNSYYNAIGQPFLRPKRGLLSRPTVKQVYQYRQSVTQQVLTLLDQSSFEQREPDEQKTIIDRIELGIQHEKQHQELFLTDLKYNFFQNPLYPAYRQPSAAERFSPQSVIKPDAIKWQSIEAGVYQCGQSSEGFGFDNERPAHNQYLETSQLASRPITNGEYLQFIADKGYANSILWLSDGWSWLQQNNVSHPLYWVELKDGWYEFTLFGLQPLLEHAPVCHINYYEADAFARWAGNRLATEFEWEVYASQRINELNTDFAEPPLHPSINAPDDSGIFHQTWQWTQSSYAQYPGFQPNEGAVGEYNGKFMCNQMVLRGGSCLSPSQHIRHTYRNFFYPTDRWQMSGLRLAK